MNEEKGLFIIHQTIVERNTSDRSLVNIFRSLDVKWRGADKKQQQKWTGQAKSYLESKITREQAKQLQLPQSLLNSLSHTINNTRGMCSFWFI